MSDVASPGGERRRVVDESEAPVPGRRGCLWIGGILGVVIGAILALYGLGPLLNHFFGEANVLEGEAYDIHGLRVAITEPVAGTLDGQDALVMDVEVELDADRDEAFTVDAAAWSLDFEDETKVEATAITGDVPSQLEAGQSGSFQVYFPPSDGEPRYVYLTEPKVRFDLFEREDE